MQAKQSFIFYLHIYNKAGSYYYITHQIKNKLGRQQYSNQINNPINHNKITHSDKNKKEREQLIKRRKLKSEIKEKKVSNLQLRTERASSFILHAIYPVGETKV